MITKELFINCINHYKEYLEFENALADLDINLWEHKKVQSMIVSFIDLLNFCCKDKPDEYYMMGSTIEQFLFDPENMIVPNINTAEELWDYLIKVHPEIKITEEKAKEKDYTPLSADELSEIYMENFSN